MKDGFWLQVGAVWGFLAVAMGAFGAHGLKDRLAELGQAASFQTAAHYHMYCALALLAVGSLILSGRSGIAATVAGWAASLRLAQQAAWMGTSAGFASHGCSHGGCRGQSL